MKNNGKFDKMIVNVPEEVDNEVATYKLDYWNIGIDSLSDDQKAYLYNA